MNERTHFIELWFLNLISCFKIYYLNQCCCWPNSKTISVSNEVNLTNTYDKISQETPIESINEDNVYIALEDYPSPTTRYATLFKGQRVVVNMLLSMQDK